MQRRKPETVDEYIEEFTGEARIRLEKMRSTVRHAAPKADEVISYGMPAYRLDNILVWFAGFKNHIGFYPGVQGIVRFKKELSKYKSAKGSVQFPHDEPLPSALVARIVKFRVREGPRKTR